jgi:hypothetical protein
MPVANQSIIEFAAHIVKAQPPMFLVAVTDMQNAHEPPEATRAPKP